MTSDAPLSVLDGLWGVLGDLWGVLGGFWGVLGRSWAPFGTPFGTPWAAFGTSWAAFGLQNRVQIGPKNIKKSRLMFEPRLNRFWMPKSMKKSVCLRRKADERLPRIDFMPNSATMRKPVYLLGFSTISQV